MDSQYDIYWRFKTVEVYEIEFQKELKMVFPRKTSVMFGFRKTSMIYDFKVKAGMKCDSILKPVSDEILN